LRWRRDANFHGAASITDRPDYAWNNRLYFRSRREQRLQNGPQPVDNRVLNLEAVLGGSKAHVAPAAKKMIAALPPW
jgi:hypothetical protein